MQEKFKVGDKVKAIADRPKGLTGKVIEVCDRNGRLLCKFKAFAGEGHNGEKGIVNGKTYKKCDLWYMGYDEVEKVKPEKIKIYRKGDKVIAVDKRTGKKTEVKTDDFMTGAKLAFERLTPQEVKEVKRAAKAGEYVKIVEVSKDTTRKDYKVGDILKITSVDDDVELWARYGDESGQFLYKKEYVVLEGYQPPEPQEEPEQLYNAKVVCTRSNSRQVTTGKIYEIKDGIFTYDDGDKTTDITDFENFKSRMFSRFIEIVE